MSVKSKPAGSPRRSRREEPKASPALDRFVLEHKLTVFSILCVLACARVFIFSAGFPLFSVVDEGCHIDLVYKAAHGRLPRGLEQKGPIVEKLVFLYHTWEYFTKTPDLRETAFARPICLLPRAEAESWFDHHRSELGLKPEINFEGVQPPVYYIVAGCWYRLGEALGLQGGFILYWIRFLNVLIMALLMWVSYVIVGWLYPSRPFMRIGVPLVLAFLPQYTFYAIDNDVLSPLLGVIAFYLLLASERRGYWFHAAAGLAVAAALLNKYTNAPILLVMCVVMAIRLRKAWRSEALRSELPRMLVMVLAAGLPTAAWFARNYSVIGSLTGLEAYRKAAGWTPLPLGMMLSHPIFTPAGFYAFWNRLMALFWRGEFIWRGQWVTSACYDRFYSGSSFLLLLISAIVLIRRKRDDTGPERFADIMCCLFFTASVALLIWMSIQYDYGRWFSPSRSFPYFAAGRLISGALVPFVILYVGGLDHILSKTRFPISRFAVLAVIGLAITAGEIALTTGPFHSAWNWFHMVSNAWRT